jgi:hypothetical protein
MQDHVNVLATAEDQLVYNFNQSSKFNGFGPRIGADMARNLGKGLAVYINGATTLLTGTSKINQYLTSVDDASFIPSRGSKVAIIPELEAKFGFKYSHPLAQGQVVIDSGYIWVKYFNALTTYQLEDTDFGIRGPYLGLKWLSAAV